MHTDTGHIPRHTNGNECTPWGGTSQILLKGSTDRTTMLSHFSRVRLCVTPQTAAHQAPPAPGILQARTLEWVAISSSNEWKWKVKVNSLSRVRLLATPWTTAYQAPPSMGFPRQEYWSGVPLPPLRTTIARCYSHETRKIFSIFPSSDAFT